MADVKKTVKVVAAGAAAVAATFVAINQLAPKNDVTFTWLPSIENTDGSPVAGPIIYTVYRKQVGSSVSVCQTKALTCKATDQPTGLQTYYVTALDINKSESAPSVSVSKTFKLPGPTKVGLDPPTNSGVE